MNAFPFVHPLLRMSYPQEVLEQGNRILEAKNAQGTGHGFDIEYQEKILTMIQSRLAEDAQPLPETPLPKIPKSTKLPKSLKPVVTPDDERQNHQTLVWVQATTFLKLIGKPVGPGIKELYRYQFSQSRTINGKKRKHQDSCSDAELDEVEENLKVLTTLYHHFTDITGKTGVENFRAFMVKSVGCEPFKLECRDNDLMKNVEKELKRHARQPTG